MVLEVHSSLSSFGELEGGAETVINTLKEIVTEEGSIFMPALRLSRELPLTEEDKKLGITVKIKVLPPDSDRTAMGLVADTFRKLPDKWFMEAGHPPVKAWYKIQEMAYEKGLIRETAIGDCKVMFFDICSVLLLYENELKRDPYGLWGLNQYERN